MVKQLRETTFCSWTEPKFGMHHPYQAVHNLLIPSPGNPASSSDFSGLPVPTHVHAGTEKSSNYKSSRQRKKGDETYCEQYK